MQHQIAFEPEVGLSAAQFVEAWNSSPFKEKAPAVVAEASGETFLSPEITIALITVAVSIPATVIASFISEYFKKKFLEDDPPKVSVTSITISDGQTLYVVKKIEK